MTDGKMMTGLAASILKTYRYVTDDNVKDENGKGIKRESETEQLNLKTIRQS